MNSKNDKISILAGNSRLCFDENNIILVEAQLKAFEAALKYAKQCKDNDGILPRISVAFDHHGIFRLQFLDDNLSNSQKKHPKLSHLHPSIQKVFQKISDQYQIELNEINAIQEDSARQNLVHTLKSQSIDESVTKRMLFEEPSDISSNTNATIQEPKQKLTCAGITKEYFERAAGKNQHQSDILEVFYEDCSWSRSLAYARGLQLSHLLGVNSGIRLNLVDSSGTIYQGEITHSVEQENECLI
ncbi:hypothetical protein F0225_14610 [Vibrio pectenicida]|uniref:Uncharacterized protein n=1 Tax=Vibrio pectenicida TaxID=62763 RepID=A0A7Y4A131_9VIBR|nr:hypothetical protein [Vibrio pectenicida]